MQVEKVSLRKKGPAARRCGRTPRLPIRKTNPQDGQNPARGARREPRPAPDLNSGRARIDYWLGFAGYRQRRE